MKLTLVIGILFLVNAITAYRMIANDNVDNVADNPNDDFENPELNDYKNDETDEEEDESEDENEEGDMDDGNDAMNEVDEEDQAINENEENESSKVTDRSENDDAPSLKGDGTDDEMIDATSSQKDPWRRRFRFRPRFRIRIPRIRIPRLRRIRLRRFRLRKLRLRKFRLRRIRFRRFRLPRFRNIRMHFKRVGNTFKKIFQKLIKLTKPKPKQPKLPVSIPCDSNEVNKTIQMLMCDPAWKAIIAPELVDEVFKPACVKHNICTSCMQSQASWTRTGCDNRLRTDMDALCKLLSNNPADGTRMYCLNKVYALYILSTIRAYPSTAQSFCGRCLNPLGNPAVPLDLS